MRRLVLLPLLAACGHESVDGAVVCFDMPAALPGTVSVDAILHLRHDTTEMSTARVLPTVCIVGSSSVT